MLNSLNDGIGARLERWMDARNTKNRYRIQLRNFLKVSQSKYTTRLLIFLSCFKDDSIRNVSKPMAMAGSHNWKFGTQEDGDEEAEEVVLRIQGVICSRELPPIQKPFKM